MRTISKFSGTNPKLHARLQQNIRLVSTVPQRPGTPRHIEQPPPPFAMDPYESKVKAKVQSRSVRAHAASPAVHRTAPVQVLDKGNGSRVGFALLQVAQLLLSLVLLVCMPSYLSYGKISERVWAAYGAYVAFFGAGTVRRMAKFGALAERCRDEQVKTRLGSFLFLLFVVTVPVAHWLAVYRSPVVMSGIGVLAKLDIAAIAGFGVAWLLNSWAAHCLGEAYNRLVRPKALVTGGPYALLQHPIYTSYMLLFGSFCMWHRVPVIGAVLSVICLAFFSYRSHIEENILLNTFGADYQVYRKSAKRFIPFIL